MPALTTTKKQAAKVSARDPQSLLAILELSDFVLADAYVTLQPHVSPLGKLGVASTAFDIDDNQPLVRQFTVPEEGESYDALVQRVKATFDPAGLARVEVSTVSLLSLTAGFPGAGDSMPSLQ